VVDPASDDARVNGSIFLEDIFHKEIESLRQKIDRMVNVIYIAGIKFDKGIGKSALLIHQWRKCLEMSDAASVYVRCDVHDTPRDICRKIIEQWHKECYLWKVFHSILTEFSHVKGDPRLAPDAVQALFDAHPSPPPSLPLTLYTQITNAKVLGENLARWASEKTGSGSDVLIEWFETYLTKPAELVKMLSGRRIDCIEAYRDIIRVMTFFGYKRHFIFLDQFEDMIMGTANTRINLLSVSLKRIVEVSAGRATVVVTLHPDSETKLRMQAAKDLTGVAPLDAVHRVDVMLLDTKGNSAIALAGEYLKYFRKGEPPYPTFPIKPELIEFISFMQQGIIRNLLQQLHNCLEYARLANIPELTLEFALKHPLEILGREIERRQIENFQKVKGIQILPTDAGSGPLHDLIADFKKREGNSS
jgi:hypothetical protein